MRWADGLSELLGRLVTWLVVAMVAVGAWNTLGRHLGRWLGVRLTSNTLLEAQWYLFAVVVLAGAGWVVRRDAHVRVDVVASRLRPRTRAWIDLLGHALLLLPFAGVTMWLAWPMVRLSWLAREGSPDPGGLPRWPLKALLLVGLGLLALQATVELARRVDELWRRPAGDPDGPGSGNATGPTVAGPIGFAVRNPDGPGSGSSAGPIEAGPAGFAADPDAGRRKARVGASDQSSLHIGDRESPSAEQSEPAASHEAFEATRDEEPRP